MGDGMWCAGHVSFRWKSLLCDCAEHKIVCIRMAKEKLNRTDPLSWFFVSYPDRPGLIPGLRSSAWSFWACSPVHRVGSLQFIRFPQTPPYTGSGFAKINCFLGVNECSRLALTERRRSGDVGLRCIRPFEMWTQSSLNASRTTTKDIRT